MEVRGGDSHDGREYLVRMRMLVGTADCAPPTGTALGGTKADAAARQVARSSERIIERPRLF